METTYSIFKLHSPQEADFVGQVLIELVSDFDSVAEASSYVKDNKKIFVGQTLTILPIIDVDYEC